MERVTVCSREISSVDELNAFEDECKRLMHHENGRCTFFYSCTYAMARLQLVRHLLQPEREFAAWDTSVHVGREHVFGADARGGSVTVSLSRLLPRLPEVEETCAVPPSKRAAEGPAGL
eukprot:1699702-Rhodomonas_salina.2